VFSPEQTPATDALVEAQQGNHITVRINGFYTTIPLSDVPSEAVAQLNPETWREIGIRFRKLQQKQWQLSQLAEVNARAS
jgi:hypothetical protein